MVKSFSVGPLAFLGYAACFVIVSQAYSSILDSSGHPLAVAVLLACASTVGGVTFASFHRDRWLKSFALAFVIFGAVFTYLALASWAVTATFYMDNQLLAMGIRLVAVAPICGVIYALWMRGS